MEGTSQAVLGSSSQQKVLASLSIYLFISFFSFTSFMFFFFFFFYVRHSKFMEKLFSNFEKMVKIEQQSRKLE
jgi:hypothetical protein